MVSRHLPANLQYLLGLVGRFILGDRYLSPDVAGVVSGVRVEYLGGILLGRLSVGQLACLVLERGL